MIGREFLVVCLQKHLCVYIYFCLYTAVYLFFIKIYHGIVGCIHKYMKPYTASKLSSFLSTMADSKMSLQQEIMTLGLDSSVDNEQAYRPRGMSSIPTRVKTFCYDMLLWDIWVFKFRRMAEHSLSFVCKNTYVFIFISALYSCLSLLHKNHHGIVGCIHKYILYYIDHERFRSVKGRLFGWQLPKMAENCWPCRCHFLEIKVDFFLKKILFQTCLLPRKKNCTKKDITKMIRRF